MTVPVAGNFTGKKLFAILSGGILVALLSFLLVINYRSMVQLRETALAQLVGQVDKQAVAVSHFYSERRIDLKNISGAREIEIFFENKALGMSMAYGLKASLTQVGIRFDQFLAERQISGTAIYDRIVFVDHQGNPLVDRQGKSGPHGRDLPREFFLTPDQTRVAVQAGNTQGEIDILVFTPFFFKGEFMGQVVAWINADHFFDHFVNLGGPGARKYSFIAFGPGASPILFPRPGMTPVDRILEAPPGTPFQYAFDDPSGRLLNYVSIKLPVSETDFSLITTLPVSDVIGYAKPSHMLLAMVVLVIFVVGATTLLWNMNARELVLNTRLEDEHIRKKEIESKNIQLEQEIQVRNQLEQTLKESEEKFRTMATAAQDGIIMVDNDADISFWNRAAQIMFGYPLEQAIHKKFYTIMTPRRHHRVHQEIFETFRKTGKGEAVGKTLEIKAKRKNGQDFPIELSLSAVKLGGKWNAIGIIRDISLRKQHEAELETHRETLEAMVEKRTRELEAAHRELINKAVDAGRAQLSAMILHNIGNAVTPVSVKTEQLKKYNDRQLNRYIRGCYDELAAHKHDLNNFVTRDDRGVKIVRYMDALIQELDTHHRKREKIIDAISTGIDYVAQILTLQRGYAPEKNVIKERVNLNRLVEDALKIQEGSLVKRRIRVQKNLVSGSPHILIERNKLMQVLVNFIKNSCDAIDENPDLDHHEIEVATFRENNGVGLRITDTGCGIEAEKLSQVFEFGISTKGSSGFGLYYCKSFVEANNGSLVLDSRGRNQGACVTMTLFPADKKENPKKG